MLISVIVPVYNVEAYLEKCVNSILHQTYKDIEVILIDDGSTDNSGAICEALAEADSSIKVLHKPNGGVSRARNLGIAVDIKTEVKKIERIYRENWRDENGL